MFRLRKLRCSFCKKNENEVSKLVAGPRVYICDACVAIASQIMNDPHLDNQPPNAQSSVWSGLVRRARHYFQLRVCDFV